MPEKVYDFNLETHKVSHTLRRLKTFRQLFTQPVRLQSVGTALYIFFCRTTKEMTDRIGSTGQFFPIAGGQRVRARTGSTIYKC